MDLAIKNVEVGGKHYRINRIKADEGSFIRALLVKQLVKVISEQGDGTAPETNMELSGEQVLSMLVNYLSEEDYKKVQKKCLSVVDRYEVVGDTETAIPVMLASGNFAIKELAYDTDSVAQLATEALTANLGPFFTKSALRKFLAQQ